MSHLPLHTTVVMAGLDPAIDVFDRVSNQVVDARAKPGHDDRGIGGYA